MSNYFNKKNIKRMDIILVINQEKNKHEFNRKQ